MFTFSQNRGLEKNSSGRWEAQAVRATFKLEHELFVDRYTRLVDINRLWTHQHGRLDPHIPKIRSRHVRRNRRVNRKYRVHMRSQFGSRTDGHRAEDALDRRNEGRRPKIRFGKTADPSVGKLYQRDKNRIGCRKLHPQQSHRRDFVYTGLETPETVPSETVRAHIPNERRIAGCGAQHHGDTRNTRFRVVVVNTVSIQIPEHNTGNHTFERSPAQRQAKTDAERHRFGPSKSDIDPFRSLTGRQDVIVTELFAEIKKRQPIPIVTIGIQHNHRVGNNLRYNEVDRRKKLEIRLVYQYEIKRHDRIRLDRKIQRPDFEPTPEFRSQIDVGQQEVAVCLWIDLPLARHGIGVS